MGLTSIAWFVFGDSIYGSGAFYSPEQAGPGKSNLQNQADLYWYHNAFATVGPEELAKKRPPEHMPWRSEGTKYK